MVPVFSRVIGASISHDSNIPSQLAFTEVRILVRSLLSLALCLFVLCIVPFMHAAQPIPRKKNVVRRDRFGDPLPKGAIGRLGTIRLRHAGEVRSVSWDEKVLVSTGADGWTHRWDPRTGRRLANFRTPFFKLPPVLASGPLVLSPDGRLAAHHSIQELRKPRKMSFWSGTHEQGNRNSRSGRCGSC